MKIADLWVREVSVPRIYETHSSTPNLLHTDTDHTHFRYQILELFTDDGRIGMGEVSDIAPSTNAWRTPCRPPSTPN